MTKTLFPASRLPWLLSAALVPLVVMLGLRSWSDSRGDVHLSCDSVLATEAGLMPSRLKLDVSVNNGQALLIYGLHQDEVELGAVRLTGVLEQWTAANLSYRLSLDKGQAQMDFSQADLPPHLRQVVQMGRDMLQRGQALKVSFRVLEQRGQRALVVFDDSQSLWSCQMKMRGPAAR